jgi:uncharacterized glyoxalase superfamily protein PhnB
MNHLNANRSMPSSSVIPILVYVDVEKAIQWLSEAFGFVERWRAEGHRAQLAYGNGALIIIRGQPGFAPGAIMIRVPDLDAHYAQAVKKGAKILSTPQDYPYGERQYNAEDIGGHKWTFSMSIADVAPEEWGGRTHVIES